MPTPQELETKFWQALKSDMTMMVGLDGVEDGHARPMTAQVDGAQGPIWFFTAKDTEIVRRLKEGNRAIATFSSKGHDLFATVHGSLHLDNDRRNIDRLWNRFVAAWFEGGKDDPKLALQSRGGEPIPANERALFQKMRNQTLASLSDTHGTGTSE